MSNSVNQTAVAPTVGQVGHKSQHGGHYAAFKACGSFALSDTLAIVAGTNNPWRPGTPGSAFYAAVLAKSPATVQAAVVLGQSALGLKPAQVQAHLRWLFTWGGAYLQVNGKLHSASVAVAPVAAPVQPAKSKVKAPAKAKVKA